MDTEEFAARVAAPLKAPVALRDDFEARVVAQVAEAARPWWRRRHQVALTPLGGLALAAGFGALMVLGGYGLGARQAPPAQPVAPSVQVVRFVLDAPEAQSVMLAGDFNGWSRVATPMESVDGTGRWAVSVTLPSGRHEYAFVVDGERWIADPYAQSARDEFGQESSVMRLEAEPRRGA
jgi:hypothetical protein